MGGHVLYDDGPPSGALHLTLECGRRRGACSYEVDPEGCAEALDACLRARPEPVIDDLSVTTTRVHHGRFDPVIEVLARHRARVSRLALGASVFPEFDRGSYVPDDRDRDGSSWHLELLLDRVFEALPSLEVLLVHGSDVRVAAARPIQAPHLQRLVVRDEALDPAVIRALGAGTFPRLASLHLWAGGIAYGWGETAASLAPLLQGAGLPALRKLALVSDLGDEVIDVLAGSERLGQLDELDLSHGTIGDEGAWRLRERWGSFAHLRRLQLTGNGIGREAVTALAALAPGVIEVGWQRFWPDGERRFEPPLVSLFADRSFG